MAVCRRCGCKELYHELQWDTVIGYECSECGYYWSIGSVGGFPGEHYFIPNMPSLEDIDVDFIMDDQECMDGYEDEDEQDPVEEQLGLSKEALDLLIQVQGEFDDDDDIPF